MAFVEFLRLHLLDGYTTKQSAGRKRQCQNGGTNAYTLNSH